MVEKQRIWCYVSCLGDTIFKPSKMKLILSYFWIIYHDLSILTTLFKLHPTTIWSFIATSSSPEKILSYLRFIIDIDELTIRIDSRIKIMIIHEWNWSVINRFLLRLHHLLFQLFLIVHHPVSSSSIIQERIQNFALSSPFLELAVHLHIGSIVSGLPIDSAKIWAWFGSKNTPAKKCSKWTLEK